MIESRGFSLSSGVIQLFSNKSSVISKIKGKLAGSSERQLTCDTMEAWTEVAYKKK